MNRTNLFILSGLATAALFAAPPARAQFATQGCPDRGEHDADHYCADVEGRAEYTDNALLVTEQQTKTADQLYVINPAFQANTIRRGFEASIRYSLNYYHYAKVKNADRGLHDLLARAALTWWEPVDLEATEELAPTPISWANPAIDPVNSLQTSRSGAHAGFRHEFGAATRAEIAYRGEYGTFIKTNKNDYLPPSWIVHGPELTAERDITELITVGLLYSYRMETFSGFKSTDPQPIDWTGHVAELHAKASPTEWLSLRARGGFKAVTYKGNTAKTRAIGDLAVAAGDPEAHADLSAGTDVTQDFLGNPATVTRARLGFSYVPTAPWDASVAATYGQLQYNLGVPLATTTVKTDQAYIEGEAGVAYHIRIGLIRLGVLHHESLTTVQTLSGNAKIVANRGFLAVGGQF